MVIRMDICIREEFETNSGFYREDLMLPCPVQRSENWEIQMPYWNAMNLMEREVELERLHRRQQRRH